MRVCVINDYPLTGVLEQIRRGEYPDHYTYGVTRLAELGCELSYIESSPDSFLGRMTRRLWRFPVPLGNLEKQWETLGQLRRADVIYSPCQTQVTLFSYARSIGLIATPMVMLMHHPTNFDRFARIRNYAWKRWIKGASKLPSLSQPVAALVNRVQPKSVALKWGPDKTFYPHPDGPGEGFITAGRTGRDPVTFMRGARAAGVKTEVIALAEQASDLAGEANDLVSCHIVHSHMPFAELTQRFSASRAICIPMVEQNRLCGLSGLLDALGLGKPVIMTRNRYIDLDIEAQGIGIWIKPGDVDGWTRALRTLQDDPERATQMGRRARALVDAGLNSTTFGDDIYRLLQEAIAAKKGH